jgi:hypothetical protein
MRWVSGAGDVCGGWTPGRLRAGYGIRRRDEGDPRTGAAGKIASRTFPFHTKLGLQVTVDAFHLINKNNTVDVNLLYTNAGQPTTAYDPRQFQFGARVSF